MKWSEIGDTDLSQILGQNLKSFLKDVLRGAQHENKLALTR
jgi:hypothetical protein